METPEEIAIVEAAWAAGLTRAEVGATIGVSARRIDHLRENRLANLPTRRQGVGGGPKALGEDRPPSRLEIRAATAAIRARWDEATWHERAVGNRRLYDTELSHKSPSLGRRSGQPLSFGVKSGRQS